MYPIFLNISAFSILLPLLTAFFYVKKIEKTYYPLLIFFIAGFINEILEGYYNIYSLLEALLLIKQLELWINTRKLKRWFNFSYIVFICLWVIESIIIDPSSQYTDFFLFTSYLTVVLLSTYKLNQMSMQLEDKLLSNPDFYFCIGFISFYSIFIIVQVFISRLVTTSRSFSISIVQIVLVVNIISHLTSTYAFLLLGKKKQTGTSSFLN